MKKLTTFLLVFLMAALAFAGMTDSSETDLGSGVILSWTAGTDSVDADTSAAFSLYPYDGITTETDTNMWEVPVGYKIYSASAGVKVTIALQGSYDLDEWIAAVTVVNQCTTETATNASIDLGYDRFPYYRVIMTGVATNSPDTVTELWLYCPWRKEGY